MDILRESAGSGAGKPVVVYGAKSLLTELTLYALRQKGIQPCCLADGRQDLIGTERHGLKVIGADELAASLPDAHVYICLTREFWNVHDLLWEKGMRNLHGLSELLENVEMDSPVFGQSAQQLAMAVSAHKNLVSTRSGNLSLPFVNLILTERCTLNCRDCTNLMPLISDRRDYSAEKLLVHMEKLLSGLDRLVAATLVGGEPFLYLELPDLMSKLSQLPKVEIIEVVTNGTMIPAQQTVETLKRIGGHVTISDYGSLSRCMPELTRLLAAHSIPYDITVFNDWYDLGGLEKRGRTEIQLTEVFKNCKFKLCPAMLDGKLYRCLRSAFGTRIKCIPDVPTEYVDLETVATPDEIRRQIEQLFFRRSKLVACDYCDGGNIQEIPIPAAIQAGRSQTLDL